MRVVLFNSRGYPCNPDSRSVNTLACIMPPIGLTSIAAVLRKEGHKVTIFDAALQDRIPNNLWASRIVALNPDFVGFSATTVGFLEGIDVCRMVKERNSQIKTVFGGVHASWGKELLLQQFPEIDYIIAGEGEETFSKLANGEIKKKIEGLFYRESGAVIKGPDRTTQIDLDTLPFPAYDLLESFPEKYLMPLFGYRHHPGANIVSSRGCVYQCSYCDRSVFGKSFRWNSPEYTFEQIKWLNKDFGIRHINFYDDLFTLNRTRVAELCSLLKESKLNVSFNCIVRIGHIDKELISLLKSAGCWMVSVGIESGDQVLLDSHKDGLSIEAIRRDIEFLNQSGLWVKGLFMMGFPGETEESIVKTREFAMSLPLKDANMTAFTPFPGAPISASIHESGKFDNDWSKMDCVNFVFVSKEIGKKEILMHHYGEFFRSFYNRKFMRKKVYPRMLIESPHSFYRLVKHAPSFLNFAKRL